MRLLEKIIIQLFPFRNVIDPKKEQFKYEMSVLRKYKNSAAIDSDEELAVLDSYASTGMVRFGYNYQTLDSEASLTATGKWFLKNASYNDKPGF